MDAGPSSPDRIAAPLGLTTAEAAVRLAQFGPNEIERSKPKSTLAIAAGVLAEPMFVLLVLAAAIYAAIGDLGEGALLAALACLSIGLVVVQERRSERALEALRELEAPKARVVRDGRATVLSSREIAPGDLVLVSEGERVAADALLVEAHGVACDESLLTGESAPASKRATPAGEREHPAQPGGDDLPFIFAGTLVVSGHGAALVTATGAATEIGRIGKALSTIRTGPTPLQLSIRGLVRTFGVLAILVSLTVAVWIAASGGGWLKGALSGIVVAMALLPEEFPMALAVLVALGAWRLAQVRVLVRRPAMVETLGAASILCVDKTGTVTENRMRVAALATPDELVFLDHVSPDLSPELKGLLGQAYLASRRSAADPIDRAIEGLGENALEGSDLVNKEWPLAREYGLTADLLILSHARRKPDGGYAIAAKGAPEAIAEVCKLSSEARAAVLSRAHDLAEKGLRVLGVAAATVSDGALPETPRDFAFRYVGLIAFRDPVRTNARQALEEARGAGIEVAMLTGDHPATARAIARDVGLPHADRVLSGADIATQTPDALGAALDETRVFARVAPEQKLQIVESLKRQGHVVAMTGDGVNDAPALKAAHIGVAMGRRGSEVAREAAGIVLMDDDFASIVAGVRAGRRIFDNLRKVAVYIIAIHVPLAGLALAPLFFGLPPLLLPAHVVLTEMVIDPICSVAFEGAREERDIMTRPPRRLNEPLAGWPQLMRGGVQGGLLLAICLALYSAQIQSGASENDARAITFIALTIGNLGLVLANLSTQFSLLRLGDRELRPFWLIASIALGALALALFWPPAADLLSFSRPDWSRAALGAGCGLLAYFAFELVKRLPVLRGPAVHLR